MKINAPAGKAVSDLFPQTGLQFKKIAAEYLYAFEELLHRVDLGAVERIARELGAARDRGATIYIAGNGGSAATASHWVNDLGKATKVGGRSPMRVMSLSDNVSWITALANDEGYERVFSGQLENFAKEGDVLIVVSASGNSPNLLRAVETARERKLLTIGFLGFDGGALKNMVDEYLWIPTEKGAYGLVESSHSLLCHILTDCLVRGKDDKEKKQADEIRDGENSDKARSGNYSPWRV
jgi:D-sedoheptulose 7-phosphate isomerase